MPFAQLDIFSAAWGIALSYVVTLTALALRLGFVRRSSQAADAPTAYEFLTAKFGFGAVAFVFSDRHRTLGDTPTTALVWAARTLFMLYFVLFALLLGALFI